jgi:putative radical SAM enzyme (TIGR03279 family)
VTTRADYGGRPSVASGGIVARVEEGSPAFAAGLRPDDRIVAVDAHQLADVLDWQWYSEGDEILVDVARGDESLRLAMCRRPGQRWGVEFRAALFDGVRTCRNACAFCFVTQLPKGLRRSLYVRDDDFRLSFMQGNFVSLTNLSDADVSRIIEQALSPLYFSLHAVTAEVRQRLVCARDDRALERAEQLLDAGVDLHVQIVLVPGVNDAEQLEASLSWLAEREGILSVGIVPLGFTGYQSAFHRSYERPQDAAAVIDQITPWHRAMRATYGTGWVYLADEFYLAARRPFPPAGDYDGFPQYENGIGLARSFLDAVDGYGHELAEAVAALAGRRRTAVVVTGELFAPVMRDVLGVRTLGQTGSGPSGVGVRVLAVGNRFFGGNVSVTGLLTAEDIVGAIRADAGENAAVRPTGTVTYLVPDVILNAEGMTLDDVDASAVGERSGQRVRLVSSDARGLLKGLSALAHPNQ